MMDRIAESVQQIDFHSKSSTVSLMAGAFTAAEFKQADIKSHPLCYRRAIKTKPHTVFRSKNNRNT